MKKFIWLFIVSFCFIACSKDNDVNEPPSFSDENFEVHQKAFDDAVKFLEGNTSVDVNTAAEFVKTLDGVTAVDIDDDIITATTQGGIRFILDFNSYPTFEGEELDADALQHYQDSINNVLGANVASGYEQTGEVFKEYIVAHQSTINTAYTSSATTRASSVQRVQLSKRNIAIWNPWEDFAEETPMLASFTKNVNKQHPLQEFTDFSPKSFEAFKEFDLVYIATHGYKDGSVILPDLCLTKEQQKLYAKEVKEDRVLWRWEKKGGRTFLLTEKFFSKYLPDLSKTIVYTDACYLGTENSTFLNSCLAKNVADYFGSDASCTGKHIIANFKKFYPKLMNGYSTNKSFANGKGYFIGSFVDWEEEKPYTYKYSRYGSKLVYYPKPLATGVGNRSNTSREATRSNSDNAVIVNAQLRYASELSGDILNNIEAGICLQDMETKKVKLIPFSNSNIVSNEKKTYDDVTVSNIAVSLVNLTENHQYAYCCYTKIDGEVVLSEECYRILTISNCRIEFKIHSSGTYYDHNWGYSNCADFNYNGDYLNKDDTWDGECGYVTLYLKDGIYYLNAGFAHDYCMELDEIEIGKDYDYDKSGTSYAYYGPENLHIESFLKDNVIAVEGIYSANLGATYSSSWWKRNKNGHLNLTIEGLFTNPKVEYDLEFHNQYSEESPYQGYYYMKIYEEEYNKQSGYSISFYKYKY